MAQEHSNRGQLAGTLQAQAEQCSGGRTAVGPYMLTVAWRYKAWVWWRLHRTVLLCPAHIFRFATESWAKTGAGAKICP
jgi:hypothetical protein